MIGHIAQSFFSLKTLGIESVYCIYQMLFKDYDGVVLSLPNVAMFQHNISPYFQAVAWVFVKVTDIWQLVRRHLHAYVAFLVYRQLQHNFWWFIFLSTKMISMDFVWKSTTTHDARLTSSGNIFLNFEVTNHKYSISRGNRHYF